MIKLNSLSLFAVVITIFYAISSVRASFIFDVQQISSSVVITGNGTLNISSLSFSFNETAEVGIGPSYAILSAGPATPTQSTIYSGIGGPSELGPAANSYFASYGTGDVAGVALGTELVVPKGYTSESPLSDYATFNGYTLSSIGLTPGVYIYTWGSGPTADSLTINIGVVPEPASLAIVGIPAAVALLRRLRGRLV